MTYTQERTAGLSSRGLMFGFILLGHVGFFWAMNTGLVSGTQIVDGVFKVIDVVDTAPQDRAEPPPPPKRIEFETVVVPKPNFDFAPDAPVGEGAISSEIAPTPTEIAVVPQVAKKIVVPMSNPRRPLTQPPYPAASQRLGEVGSVVLDLYVLENGRVGDATVVKSSGFARLDQAAVEEAKRAWRLLPGTEDGRAIAMHHQLTVTFRLNN